MSSLLQRWYTRRARLPRWLRASAALALSAYALTFWASSTAPGTTAGLGAGTANPPTKLPKAPGPGNPTTTFRSSVGLVFEGRQLYDNGCSSCHGLSLQGKHGVAPSLVGVGAGPVDFYLSTGRMPMADPRGEPERSKPAYGPQQIEALIAFVESFGGPPAPSANPSQGDLALGLHQFALNCAGCHQIVGRGGLTVGAPVPDLQRATPLQIAEAIRMGPYLMPNFGATQIDQHELDSIARYVLWTRHPSDAGGWGIGNLGPIPEGMVAWFIALAALVIVARLIGERTA
jgi:ubiquinol-cytochrome c reductase cytochrome c subunit